MGGVRAMMRAVVHRLPPRVRMALEPLRRRARGEITRRHVVWAYRLMLDREPDGPATIDQKYRSCLTAQDLRAQLLGSEEFRSKNPGLIDVDESAVVIAQLEGGLRLYVDLVDHAVGLPIARGRFERDELEAVRRIVHQGDNVLDIGANLGLFTVVLGQAVGPGGTVHAFEPRAEIANLLRRSVDENRFADRVHIHRAAAGAVAGSMRLTYSSDRFNQGGAFLVREGTTVPEWMLGETVDVVTLDALHLPRPVAFIKMDIEGAEPLCVEGAADLLAEDRPVILSEIHAAQLRLVAGRTAAEFIGEMGSRGYRCHRLDGPRPGPEVSSAGDADVFSVLFMPRETRLPG